MSVDLSLNRVYWQYVQNKTHLRPKHDYLCSAMIPSIGVRATIPIYYRRGNTIRDDLVSLVKQFAKRYPDNRYVISLSGGIDSEITAETFYELGIPFRVLTLKLFEGSNYHDIMWAVKYCRQRNLKQKIINLTLDKMLQETIPEGVEHGQFTHSYSQIALTELFNHIEEDEILINSGHNPDFHTEIGIGWWEDSPNIVKYSLAKKHKFFTFTSLEPIFCHYAANYDKNQPGDKDNDFLYASFPTLQRREKLTGWEYNSNIIGLLQERIRSCAAYKHQSFITWETFTLAYMRKVFVQKGLQGKYYE